MHLELCRHMLNGSANLWIGNFSCFDGEKVDVYHKNLQDIVGNNSTTCGVPATIAFENPGNIYRVVVEIAYKVNNVGATTYVRDAGGNVHTAIQTISDGSTGTYIYQADINGGTTSITYDNTTNCNPSNTNGAESMTVFVFRDNAPNLAQRGYFTVLNSVNDQEYLNFDIPQHTTTRNIALRIPISQITLDGKYMRFVASAGGVSAEKVIRWDDAFSTPSPATPPVTVLTECCGDIVDLVLEDVPGTASQLVLEVDTRNSNNGGLVPGVDGQSYTIAEFITIDAECRPPNGWSFDCDDSKTVEIFTDGIQNSVPSILNFTNSGNITGIIAELVYKGCNPGPTVNITDLNNNTYTAFREEPLGGSSDVYVYRAMIDPTSGIRYENQTNENCAQSFSAFVFRNKNTGVQSSGVFTNQSGFNDVQVVDVPIPVGTSTRTVTVEMPVSQLTEDGRYIHIEADAGTAHTEITETITAGSLPKGCCVKIFKLTLNDVPSSADQCQVDNRYAQWCSCSRSWSSLGFSNSGKNRHTMCGMSNCGDPGRR